MHKITSKPITRESFEMDDYCSDDLKIPVRHSTFEVDGCELQYEHRDMVDTIIEYLENLRLEYIAIIEALKLPQGDPDYVKELQARANQVWKELIRWLPESWLQTRTVTMNYETVRAMCSSGQRRFHKLNEWSGKDNKEVENFISWARTLPYAAQFIFSDETYAPTMSELCGKALKDVCKKLTEKEMKELNFSTLDITVLNPDQTYKSVFEIFSELAEKFDKNEIF